MTEGPAARAGWSRRDVLRTGAAVAAGAYAMRWGLAPAATSRLGSEPSNPLV